MRKAEGSCPLCGHGVVSINPLFSNILCLPGNTNSRVVGCNMCGLHFLSPYFSDEQLGNFYATSYFTFEENNHRSEIAPVRKQFNPPANFYEFWFRPNIDMISAFATNSKNLLDVGAGTGEFLQEVKKKWPSLSLSGVEFSADAAKKAEDKFGFHFAVGTLEDLIACNDESFDIITLNHVLEHILEPHKVTASIRHLLSERGIVYVQVPMQFNYLEILQYRLKRVKPSYSVNSVHHAIFYNPSLLVRLFQMDGFELCALHLIGPRYLGKDVLDGAKKLIWSILSRLGQCNYIEAVFIPLPVSAEKDKGQ